MASFSLTAAWELYFDDKLNTTTVYQVSDTLPKGHLMNSTNLTAIKISYDAVPHNAVSDLNQILNKEALYPLNKGTIAVTDFFDSPDVIPDVDQMIVPIPNDWIYALPGSLRRRDQVNIFTYRQKDTRTGHDLTQAPISPVLEVSTINSGQLLFPHITVAYAKDSANQEVKPSDNKLQRIDATGNIAQLELILTSQQFKLLETKSLEGYKFIFTYR